MTTLCHITRDVLFELGGERFDAPCAIDFNYWPGEPWSYHSPGAPAECEIIGITAELLDWGTVDLTERLSVTEIRRLERMLEERR